jgi:hypothetical protein
LQADAIYDALLTMSQGTLYLTGLLLVVFPLVVLALLMALALAWWRRGRSHQAASG